MPGWKRNIGLFLAGQSATMVGSMLVSFAVLWHLTLRTQSGWVTTAVIVFGMLPQAVVSLWGGPWADRYNRKTLLVVGSLGTAVATVVLALLLHGGVTDLWIFYLTMAVRSMLMGITTPAASAAIPGIVPATQLMRVNGINEAIASAALLVSPLVTGGIYETLGLVPIFVIDVGTSLLAVTFVMFLPALRAEPSAATEPDAPAAAPETGPRVLCELRAGLRYVASQAAVRWLLVIYALAMTVAAAPSFLTPLMMARSFGPDVWRLTANEMFWAAGSLLAGLVMMSFGPRIKRHLRVILVALVATGFLSVAIGLSTNMWVYLGLLFLIAVAFSAITVPEFTMLQQMVDPAMLGRSSASSRSSRRCRCRRPCWCWARSPTSSRSSRSSSSAERCSSPSSPGSSGSGRCAACWPTRRRLPPRPWWSRLPAPSSRATPRSSSTPSSEASPATMTGRRET